MKSTLLFLSLACALGQNDGGEWALAPQLPAGVELVYSGTCTEESLLKDIQHKRVYRFENRLLVLSADVKSYDVAFMTSLSAREPGEPPKYSAVSVKLDVATIDAQGRVKAAGNVHGSGTLPLLEVGCFVEAPVTRVGKNSVWEVPDDGRPPRSWLVLGSEMCGGLMCAKLQGQQQSEDWEQPRADRTAWRRRDVVWVALRMGVAVKVERTLERRDPARREPSHRTVTEYAFDGGIQYSGKLFDDRKREVLQAKRFSDDAAIFLKQPAQNPTHIDALLRRVSFHLESPPATPYRKAVVHLAQRIDSARKGELLLVEHRSEEAARIGPLRIGQKVPDTVLTELTTRKTLRLNRLLGRPVLVVYYNPHTQIGVEVLQFTKGVAEKMGDRVAIMAMAVTTQPDVAHRQHADMKLPFPILDGSALRLTFAVEATPRFIVLDAEGCVRASATGWAAHVGDELIEEIGRVAAPALGVPPAGGPPAGGPPAGGP
jgi:peroxiredoxin